MALSQDQNDQLNKSIMGQFGGPPKLEAPTFAPSSFDVDSMGPNMDSTVKMAGQVPGAPAPIQDMTPKPMPAPAPAPMPTVAPVPPVDTATDDEDDDETRKSNPKVASSHPGFNQDELEKYLLKQKGDIDKYGADNQAASMKNLHDQQNGVVSSIGRRMASASDAIMQGVARAGNSGNLAAYDARQARNEANNNAQLEQLNAANTAAQKAKMGLDTQSNQNPLGQATAAAMLPILKQIYPGKTDAEYMQMARNPAVAEALLPESVKLREGEDKIKAAHEDRLAGREIAQANREEMRQDRLEHQAQNGLASIRGDSSLKNVETQRDAAIQAYNRISQIESSGKGMNPIDYVDVLGQIYKARTGTAPTEVILNAAKQATLQGNFGKAYTFLTGQQAPATTPAIMSSLKDMVTHMGKQADQLHDGYMRSHGSSAFPAGLNDEAKTRLGAQGRGLSFAEATGVTGQLGTQAHPQDDAAVVWAQQHPTDPRAARILKVNGK